MDPTQAASQAATQAGNNLSIWTANNGLAVVMLLLCFIVGIFFTWKLASWSGSNLFIPLRDAAVKHLNDVGEVMHSVNTSLHQMREEMTTTRAAVENHGKGVDAIHTRLDRIENKGCGLRSGVTIGGGNGGNERG